MARKKAAAKSADVAVTVSFETLDPRELYQRNEHKYLLVNLISSRALEIKKGARATVDIQGPHTNLELAIAETQAGHLRIKKKEEERKVVSLID